METVKIVNNKTKVVKVVNKNLASDYIGTGEFKLFDEKEKKNESFSSKSIVSENVNNSIN